MIDSPHTDAESCITILSPDVVDRVWTLAEETRLIDWAEQGKSFEEIGVALGRSDLAVGCKYLELVPMPGSESDGKRLQELPGFKWKQNEYEAYATWVWCRENLSLVGIQYPVVYAPSNNCQHFVYEGGNSQILNDYL